MLIMTGFLKNIPQFNVPLRSIILISLFFAQQLNNDNQNVIFKVMEVMKHSRSSKTYLWIP